jgi:site-specific DNA-methyltransferase (adenine-specific)
MIVGPENLPGRAVLHCGDCLVVLPTIPTASVDSIVTDPPYGLEFMGKEWDTFTGAGMSKPGIGAREIEWPSFMGSNTKRCAICGLLIGHGGSPCRCNTPQPYNAALPRMQGFGRWCEIWATECLRVLRPGGHLIAFGGSRTYHRLACAIEDSGFEIRDQIQWLYGSGFPKSFDVSKAIDSAADAEWDGWGTALKPACEPMVLARKPLVGTVAENVQKHRTGALNIDACRVESGDIPAEREGESSQDRRYTAEGGTNFAAKPGRRMQRQQSNRVTWEGGIASGFKADHVQPIYNGKGRWPANVIHDGSEEVLAAFPETSVTGFRSDESARRWDTAQSPLPGQGATNRKLTEYPGDTTSAARFFYAAKADVDDRLGSKHPTVKPVDLMQYLVRLVTPKGGTVLDLFAGTGTTGEAAFREGMQSILIEREPEYQADIRRRMALTLAGPGERARATMKARIKDKPVDHGPLFSEVTHG